MAYAIRLQTILDEVKLPQEQGVEFFKRGVLDPASPRPFVDSSAISTALAQMAEAVTAMTKMQQANQQSFVAQILAGIHQSSGTPTPPAYTPASQPPQYQFAAPTPYQQPYVPPQASQPQFAAPVHCQQPYAPAPNPTYVPPQPQYTGQPQAPSSNINPTPPPNPGRNPKNPVTPVQISQKADCLTQDGQLVCGRCERLGHGSAACPRQKFHCNVCNSKGHHPYEHLKYCNRCKGLGHTSSRCPDNNNQ